MSEKKTSPEAMALLERTLQQGLPAVGHYLRQQTGHAVHVADQHGMECYPQDHQSLTDPYRETFEHIPDFTDDQYFYDKNHQLLILRCTLADTGHCLFLFFEDTTPDEIVTLIERAEPAHLALTYYLREQRELHTQMEHAMSQLLERIFQGNNIRIDALLSQYGLHLSPDQNYAVMILQLPEDTSLSVPDLMRHMQDFSREHALPALFPLEWQGMHLVILSGFYQQAAFRSITHHASHAVLEEWQQACLQKFHVQPSIGIGGDYPLNELQQSLLEARMALTFRTIKGQHGFIQWFNEMGIFCELFRCSPTRIHTFCRQTLDKLLEYDHNYDADLQITLRTLLDNNFNYKATAEALFVHVNTVRYRAEKIAQLLDIDLGDAGTRFNLYAALRVGDVRRALDLLQPGYVGTIHSTETHHAKNSKAVF